MYTTKQDSRLFLFFCKIYFTCIAILALVITRRYSLEILHPQYFYFNIGILFLNMLYFISFTKKLLIRLSKLDLIFFVLISYIIIHSLSNAIIKEYTFTIINLFIIYVATRSISSRLLKNTVQKQHYTLSFNRLYI